MGGRAGGGASGGMGSRSGAAAQQQAAPQPAPRRARHGFRRPESATSTAESRYNDERQKAINGIYSGDYQAALKSSTTVEGAIKYLEGKAQEYQKSAQSWAGRTYKKTKAGVEGGAKWDEFGHFKTFTAINESRKNQSVKRLTKAAKDTLGMIDILKSRVYQ